MGSPRVHLQLGFYSTVLLLYCAATIKSQESGDGGFAGCTRQCGNVSISGPFGIEPGCYTNSWFRITCNKTRDGFKPFLSRINLEFLLWLWSFEDGSGGVQVKVPVTYVNCDGTSATFDAINKPNSPFFFSSRSSVFGSVGCGNLVTIYGNQSSTNQIIGIVQPRCSGDDSTHPAQALGFGASYAQTSINLTSYEVDYHITSYTVTSTQIYPGNDKASCKSSVFMFSRVITDPKLPFPRDINIDTKFVTANLEWNRVECDLEAELCRGPVAAAVQLGCIETCGNVSILYPFGIKPGCYRDKWFQVTCNETGDGLMIPFLRSLKLQILSILFDRGTVRVNNSVTYFSCHDKRDNRINIDLTGSPFFFSNIYNRFGSIGCDNLVTISDNRTGHFYPIGGCVQPRCSGDNVTPNSGCLMTIPSGVSSFVANMTEVDPSNGNGSSNKSCGYAFIVDVDSFDDEGKTFEDRTHVSTVLEWGTPTYGLCGLNESSKVFCSADGVYCWTNLSSTHLCVCNNESRGDFGTDVCGEAEKCGYSGYRYCYILCLNTPGNHCSSSCPDGYEYFIDENMCKPRVEPLTSPPKNSRDWAIIIGCITSIGTGILLLGIWYMYKVLKKRKEAKLKQKYFKRNGGLLLQQQLSASEGNVERIRLFTSKELEKATDYYNPNRVLGQGGQGTVYKGMLTDGSIVAVKKSKIVEERKIDDKKLQQFINEVIILSQINHRNVVKLLGCCLETKVPLLVYEFISNGTLYELIHHQNEEFPLTWDMRFRVAIEIANALSYLHSAASVPIYHRDIKSSNILLDDKYRAKVSDFGTSRSVTLEQTHLTTRVQGTFGYLDPEYFRSNQFTEKSDVYSFGVVLVELLTGQKPIPSVPQNTEESEEVRSLVPFFLLSMRKSSLNNVLDLRIAKVAPQEEIIAIAKLAKRCLNLKGKRRPTMKQVALELELIRAYGKATDIHQEISDDEEEEYSDRDDVIQPWDMASCSSRSAYINNSVLLDTDDHTTSL